MSTVGIGVDVVDVDRFAALLERQPTLAGRLFTAAERADAGDAPERLAARFAAKEALLKALESGLGAARWHDIEVRKRDSGAPYLALHGAAADLCATRGVERLLLSLSHTATTATAFVVGESS